MADAKTAKPSSPKSGLASRLLWYIRVRWLFVGLIMLPSLILRLFFKNSFASLRPTLIIALIVIFYNLCFWWLTHNKKSVKSLKKVAKAQLAADLVGITYLIFRGGGVESHSAILYLIPILASGALFHGRAMLKVAGAAAVLYSVTAIGQYFSWLPSPANSINYDRRTFFTLVVFTNSSLMIIALVGNYFIKLINQDNLKIKSQRVKTSRLLRQIQFDSVNFQIRTSALFNSIGEGLIVVNEYGTITDVNQATLDILGFERNELINKWFPKVIVNVDNSGKLIPTIKRPTVQALETGKAVKNQSFYINKAGESVAVSQVAAPFMVNKKPSGGVIVFHSVQEEIELQKAKDDFVSLASHQLRTPATAVKNFIGLLKDGYAGSLTKEQSSFVNRAYENNERQLNLINDLLNVARTESGQLALNRRPHDILKLVNEAVKDQSEVIASRRQKVEIIAPKRKAIAKLDDNYFKMAIENLLTNASKYTPSKGKITINLKNKPKALIVSVADSGVGISDKDFDKLFKKFSRVENPISQNVEGTGVGLYLVKQVLHLHQGSVDVKSSPGKGSVFTLTFPQTKKGGKNG